MIDLEEFYRRAKEVAETRTPKPIFLLAREFGLSYDGVRNRIKTLKSKGHKELNFSYAKDDSRDLLLYPELPRPEKSFDQVYDDFRKLIGKSKKLPAIPKSKNSKTKKILAIFDPHLPFIDEKKFAHIITKEPADEIIVGGDVDDLYPLSRFLKLQVVSPIDCLAKVDWFLHTLSETYPVVKLLRGNHDKRVVNYFLQHNIPTEIVQAFVKTDYLTEMARPYKNIQIVSTKVEVERHPELFFFYVFGDCVIGHWETYSKVNLRSAENCWLWYQQWQSTLNLPPIRCLIQGHTHQLGSREVWGDKRYGEGGCLCDIQDYTIEGRVGYSPPASGYWLIYQTNGLTDMKETRYISL